MNGRMWNSSDERLVRMKQTIQHFQDLIFFLFLFLDSHNQYCFDKTFHNFLISCRADLIGLWCHGLIFTHAGWRYTSLEFMSLASRDFYICNHLFCWSKMVSHHSKIGTSQFQYRDYLFWWEFSSNINTALPLQLQSEKLPPPPPPPRISVS